MSKKERLKPLNNFSKKFTPGPKNSITDLDGIRAGHLTIQEDLSGTRGEKLSIRTGLTTIIPCDMRAENRLFSGNRSFRQTETDTTAYQVLDDFHYLNSPIVLTNAGAIGKAYNAILSYGFSLGRSEVWPPLVLGINDSYLSHSLDAIIDEQQIVRLFQECSSAPVEEGSIGIGIGLRAFGWKGGIGTASRQFSIHEKSFLFGVLVATNHGTPPLLHTRKKEPLSHLSHEESGSLSIISATDAPVLPLQIDQIITSIVLSLPTIHSLSNPSDSINCTMFSTANAMSLKNEGPALFHYSAVNDSFLTDIVKAGFEATHEALLRSLALSLPVKGRENRTVSSMPEKELEQISRHSHSIISNYSK